MGSIAAEESRVRQVRLGYKYPATSSLFFEWLVPHWYAFASRVNAANAFCSLRSLLRCIGPFDTDFEVYQEAARGELKYAVGATVKAVGGVAKRANDGPVRLCGGKVGTLYQRGYLLWS